MTALTLPPIDVVVVDDRAVITIADPAVVWSLNAERSEHWRNHRHRTETARLLWSIAARQLPRYEHLTRIAAQPYAPTRNLPDTGNVYPAVKAAIDGLVDRGTIPDDSPKYVHAILLLAPVHRPPGGLQLTLTGTLAQ